MTAFNEVEQAELGVQFGSDKKVRGMLFADDFVGVPIQRKACRSNKWALMANVSKSAVIVFVEDAWKWGEHRLPKLSS